MAFSLTSLITILALAFVVTPAMAQDFDVTLDETGDISEAGDLQVLYVGQSELTVTFESAEAIVLPAGSVFVTTYDRLGKLVSIPEARVVPTTAAKTLMVTIPVDPSIFKVNIKINEGITAADPLNAKKSKKVDVNIHLVNSDQGGPTIYSIRRAADPLLPVTADTFQVIITLSEMAKEFKKANVRISDNATITKDPEALQPVREITATQALANARITRTFRGVPPVVRGLYNVDINGDGETDDSTSANDINTGERGAHGLIDAIIDAGAALDKTTANAFPATAYTPPSLSSTDLAAGRAAITAAATALENAILDYHSEAALAPAIDAAYVTGLLPIAAETPLQWPQIATSTMVTLSYVTADGSGVKLEQTADTADATRSSITFSNVNAVATTFPGIAPDPTDYETLEAYNLARVFYSYKVKAKAIYMDAVAVKTAYDNAVDAVMDMDNAAASAYLQVELETAPGDAPAIQLGTGRDDMLYPYVVTIAPKYTNKDDIVIKAGAFEDTTKPISNKYIPPDQRFPVQDLIEGVDMLTVKVGREDLVTLAAGSQVYLPHGEGAKIPGNGFYIFAKNKDGSGIGYSHEKDAENLAHKQTPAQLLFNVRAGGIPNLENLFLQGGTIDLVAYDGTAATAAYISEVMWGSDASQGDSFNSQWIEIANTTASAISVAEKKWALWVYQAHETPPAAYTGGTLIDRIGAERSDTGVFWSVVGTAGQSGRTNIDPGGADVVAIAPTKPLISMVRVTDAAGAPEDGTLPTSWASSTGPSVNFKLGIEGTRVATPGAADIARPTAPTPPPTPPAVPVASAADIMITEVMVDAGNGRLPQWIELSHVGTGEVSLAGWEMVIDNAIDADVLGGGNAITVSLSGVTLDVSAHTGNTGKGQSALVVAWASARHSTNLRADRIVNLATQLNQTRQYQLLSYKGFRITLVPPQTGAIAAFGDVAGNLDEEWELPMAEGSTRSSIIRREMAGTPAAKTLGTDANGWLLASETSLSTGQVSYYGSDEDSGTPGQDSGGPLPVELSHFRPARDKQTGAVVITWATQSELNNAGFYIKRSNQRNGQFEVVNPTMIPGAGTTSEKQFYTYTDTTAQPNVVYYYQIEDVSLDGNRQTLTNGIRLKGHIGAAGKATTTWGELKTSNE
jgi:hypothetical protein